MKKIITLITNDLRQILRDPTLSFFMIMPFLLLIFIRLFVPYITELYPQVADYHTPIMMLGAMQTAIMFGFVQGFIILDEKDEQVLQAIRILPISPYYFWVYRLFFAYIFSVFGAVLLINFSTVAYPGFLASLLLSLQYGLNAPIITLILATYAQNKVEGMAYFKGIDLLLVLPILAFVLSGFWTYFLAIVPAFWTYSFYAEQMSGQSGWYYLSFGTLLYVAAIYFLLVQFQKRVWG